MASTIARDLAEWCAALRWHDVPPEARAALPLRLLDTAGLILAGAPTPAGKAALALAESQAGAAQSTAAGAALRVPAAMAALVHGIAAHCHDFDDTFMESVVHPGSVVIPTALSLAEANDGTAEAFGLAVTVGYEVAARLGAVAGRRFHARSLHPTGIIGPIAAAAAAARLLALDGERTAWAMGLAASMSGGIRAFAVDGGWSKWLHVGWAAHGGIVAADLASLGFRGPEHVFEGGHDLYSALLHGEPVDRSGITRDLGRTWTGTRAEFKYFPCAHVIQPYIGALLALVERHALGPSDIAGIECSIAPWAAAIVCEPREAKLRPRTQLEATGSLPYQLTAAVFDGGVGLSALRPESLARADLLEFARRIEHREDATLGRNFDGAIRVRTAAGDCHEREARADPVDGGRLKRKFVGLAGPLIGDGPAEDAAAALLDAGVADWRWARDLIARA